MIAPEQIRAARALLRIEQDELARRAQVSIITIRRLEAPNGRDRVSPRTIESIRRALEQAGAEFIPSGVRTREKPASPDTAALFTALRDISLQSAELLQGHAILTDDDLYGADGLPQ